MEELRPALEEALVELVPQSHLVFRWEDDVLHAEGSGFRGTLRVDGGSLRSEVRLRPPLSLFRSTIESRLTRALQAIATR